MDRWARAWAQLSDSARSRVGLENDERLFSMADALELHRQTGVRLVYDHHHARINPGGLRPAEALAAAAATWPAGMRPKVHLSSPRLSVGTVRRPIPGTRRHRDVAVPPPLGPHADLVSPWDFAGLMSAAPRDIDVMLEAKAKAKDVALVWLRTQLATLLPALAAAEERISVAPAGALPSPRPLRQAPS